MTLGRDGALSAFGELYRQWEREWERSSEPGRPPAWPAEQFAAIPLTISDDIGTSHRHHSGEIGGQGSEFQARWNFLPVPPDRATKLTLRFTRETGAPVVVELPLLPAVK